MIDKNALAKLNERIYERGSVDREQLLEFLTLINTNDGRVVSEQVKAWLKDLEDDPKYDKITFPRGDIDAILSDLDSYNRIQPDTLYGLKQPSNRELRAE